MKTISYSQFEQQYFEHIMRVPDYRLGQMFCWMFIKDSSTPEMCRLWNEKDIDTARKMIYSLIEDYNWNSTHLPLLEGREIY